MQKEEKQERRIRFDGTINLGHVLTFVGFIASGFAAYSTMDKRITVLEEARLNQRITDQRQDAEFSELKKTMREDIKEVMRKIDILLERGRP